MCVRYSCRNRMRPRARAAEPLLLMTATTTLRLQSLHDPEATAAAEKVLSRPRRQQPLQCRTFGHTTARKTPLLIMRSSQKEKSTVRAVRDQKRIDLTNWTTDIVEKTNQKSVWNRGHSFWRPFRFASNILSQDARSVRLEDSIGAMHALATDSISKNSLI